MPTEMRAVVITRPGGPEVLEVRDVPAPEPQGDQVRVRVRACGLNRADLMQARGYYPAPPGVPADIPGLEFAGEVDALGPGVDGAAAGRRPGLRDRRAAGGRPSTSSTHERMAVPIPANLDFEEAAAVPEVFITAHDALETQARLRPGERVLIHAVGSGVGTAAVPARACDGLHRLRHLAHRRQARAGGASSGSIVAIDTSADDFAEVVAPRDRRRGGRRGASTSSAARRSAATSTRWRSAAGWSSSACSAAVRRRSTWA